MAAGTRNKKVANSLVALSSSAIVAVAADPKIASARKRPPAPKTEAPADCDYVSGATESANAFYWAVIDALNKAK